VLPTQELSPALDLSGLTSSPRLAPPHKIRDPPLYKSVFHCKILKLHFLFAKTVILLQNKGDKIQPCDAMNCTDLEFKCNRNRFTAGLREKGE